MRRRIIALGLALALTLSLGAATALAEDQTAPETAQQDAADGETAAQAQEETEGQGETDAQETADAADGQEAESGAEAASPAGPDGETAADEPPDPAGTVRFESLERRMRASNLTLLSLEESIASVESVDYEEMYDDLKDSLNGIARIQWILQQTGQKDSFTYAQLDQSYESLRDTFEDLKDGKLQEDSAGAVRQLRDAQDQVIMAGESLYTALAAMELQEAGLQRQLDAMDRTVEEMELRYTLGQVSSLQLEQTKAGRASLQSGLETLRMNIRTYKTQLELLLGAELTGEIALGPVPQVEQAQLDAMDLERDLETAKARSYELYAADQTLEDAREAYRDVGRETNYSEHNYQFVSAQHTWQAAQYTHDAAFQDYELRMRTLYAQVGDYRQILSAAQVSLESERAAYAAEELRYQQGKISRNALLTAQDDLRAAEDAVESAAIDLFSAYNTYCWAVEHGILN